MAATPTSGGSTDRPAAAVDRLTADDVRRWATDALAELGRAREEIDALNVFPVADADTGTNLYLTMEAAAQALPPEVDALAKRRWEAKKAKDFAAADKLRAELTAAGWSMLDSKDGYKIEPLKKA